MIFLNGGLLAAASILSIKTGLVLGASRLGGGALVLTASGFGGGMFLLTVAFAGRQHLLVEALDRYTFTGAVLVALALICLGLQEPSSDAPKKAGGGGGLDSFLGFLPCPLCMAALAFSVIIVAQLVGVSLPVLGFVTAAAYTLLTTAVAFGARKLIMAARWRPVAIFNQLLFFTGVLTLTFALTIPNFVQAMATPMGPLEVPSPGIMASSALVLAGFVLAGYLRQQLKFNREG